MFQRVSILYGKFCGTPDEHGCCLWFALTPRHDAPTVEDYRGQAWVDGNRLVLGDPATDVTLYEYEIGEATPASIDRRAGHRHAMGQKIARKPKTGTLAYFSGWRDGWESRRAK